MKRIKLVLAVGVVMAALLALTAGSALADDEIVFFDNRIDDSEIEEIDVNDGKVEFELENGDEIETYDYDLLDELDLVNDDKIERVLDID
jgi:coenzyme F420-reducing hydrogenase beta subunit